MRAWVSIDTDSLRQNVRNVKGIIAAGTQLMGIIKADGYGHGVLQIAGILKEEGISYFGVASADEGFLLRENGFKENILILGYTAEEDYGKVIENQLCPAIYTLKQAEALNLEAERRKKKVKVHIKLDTGMCRLGFKCNETAVREIRKISELKNIVIEGVFTHLATADSEDKTLASEQFRRFIKITALIESQGVKISLKHIANSAATLNYPEMHLNMVRVGLLLYGLYPSSKLAVEKPVSLTPVMSIKAKLAQVKWVEQGALIGYGAAYKAKKRMKIGIVPIGYGDGMPRSISGKGFVSLDGKKCPIIGKICMDQFMIDITDVSKDVDEGDEVVVMGRDGNSGISADEIAAIGSTISYEIVTRIGKRLPRIS